VGRSGRTITSGKNRTSKDKTVSKSRMEAENLDSDGNVEDKDDESDH
jgi:hypothetical protein